MHAEGFDENSGRALVIFEGADARNLGLALRAALEQVDDIDLPIRVGLGRVHVDTLVKELNRVQTLIDASREVCTIAHLDEWCGMDLSLEVVGIDAGAGRAVVGLTSRQVNRMGGALLELTGEVSVRDFPAVVGVDWETVGVLYWELGRAWINLPREHQNP